MSSPQMMTMLGLAAWASASPGAATNNASNAISTRVTRFIVVLQSGSLFEREDLLPVGLHVDDRPAPALGLVERLVQAADVRPAVVRPLAHVVGVAHDAHEARALPRRCPLKHLLGTLGGARRFDLGCCAPAIQSATVFVNSSVAMPVCVASRSSTIPFWPDAATAFMSPSSTALNGCLLFHSGCFGASARTRSRANASWK